MTQLLKSGDDVFLMDRKKDGSAESGVDEKIYFEPGTSLHTLCAGDEVKLLRTAEELFSVEISSRENLVALSGGGSAVDRAKSFFEALVKLHRMRGRQLEARDVELLCRMFRNGSGGELDSLWAGRVSVSPKKRDILPRSRRQLEYVRLMREKDVVFGVGPAGTGKTYLAMAVAVSEFLANRVSRIVLTRPARESGERLGFLPGSLEEKVSPYLRPLYDALYEIMGVESYQRLVERGTLEVAPLAFMRGRTLGDAFIILDEAQNTTPEQMKMFLTRLGASSRCIVTGDISQIDLPKGRKSGLVEAMEVLRNVDGIHIVELTAKDVVRHELVQKIVRAYEAYEAKEGEDT